MKLECTTSYPYDMTIKYNISGRGKVAVRIPKWSREFSLKVNGKVTSVIPKNGYIYIDVDEKAKIELALDGTPRYVRAVSYTHLDVYKRQRYSCAPRL